MRPQLLAVLLTGLATAPAATFPGLKLESGFSAEVFANSNQVGNAVAICFDRAGRLYSVEANRRVTGTWGVTMSRWWSMEDYGNTTLEDRAAMYARWTHIVPPAKLTRDADVLRRIVDSNADGTADGAAILDRFNGPLDGNAAGVLAWDDQLFVANAPTLWRAPLAKPARRKALHTGIGVRVGVYGHDLHGLIAGPDGRLYFSIGDRGFHLRNQEGTLLSAPRRGAVFRCFPDGTGLEVFHIGLRNPQDLAFNEVGDLFTVDNDMGGVDRSRVVHVIEGGDSGWDATYQLTRNFREETDRAGHTEPPWFTERLWETRHEGQPAWLHPPIAHLTQGPSGMEFDPGWGLPGSLRNAMFVCDFRGTSSRSGIFSFNLEPDGAGWRMTHTNQFAWGILPADIEFGHDGCLYVADWIGGWGGNGERRIVRLAFQQSRASTKADEVRALMAGDWRIRSTPELAKLLAHFDRRVRLAAQYELARRKATEAFSAAADNLQASLAERLHGVHGLWQSGLRHPLNGAALTTLDRLLLDPHPELRAQAARVIGEVSTMAHAKKLTALLDDQAARVRHFATVSLAKLGAGDTVQPLVELLRQERDPIVRHGAVSALSRLASPGELVRIGDDHSPRVRLAAVLGLRRLTAPEVSGFLDDRDPAVRAEAIRAAHDLSIPGTINALAEHATPARLADESVPFPLRHRLMNARFRRGKSADAALLAAVANDALQPQPIRAEALDALEHWAMPSPFDRVTWHHRPVNTARDTDIGNAIAGPTLQLIARSQDPELLKRAARLVTRFQLGGDVQLHAMVTNPRLNADARRPVFEALLKRQSPRFKNACRSLLQDKEESLRILAAEQLYPDADAVRVLETLWKSGSAEAKQLLLTRATLMHGKWGTDLLKRETPRAAAGNVSALSLDLLEAAAASPDPQLRDTAADWRRQLSTATNGLGEYNLALAGGNPAKGRQLFATHAVQCVRCHQIKGFGGDAGPDLSRIARSLKRPDLVTALIDPSARIAPGFGTFEFEMNDGEELAGFVEKEDASAVTLLLMDGERRRLETASIRKRSQPASAMPTMREVLSLSEIRDLVAYLSSLR